MLVLLGLFPIVGTVFSLMPDPVLGGATLLMFGTVAAAGIRIISSQEIGRKETLVLAVSLSLGPVSYTHLDVYKRQIYATCHCLGLDNKNPSTIFFSVAGNCPA